MNTIQRIFQETVGLLREPEGFVKSLETEENLRSRIFALLFGAWMYFAAYGTVIGFFHSPLQAVSSALKLPLLYLLTLGVCLPTLFVFNTIIGTKNGLLKHVALLMGAMNITGAILVSFGSVTLFFLTTIPEYEFFQLINVVFFAISGYFGVRTFRRILLVSEDGTNEAQQVSRVTLLKIWMLLYGVVGAQLGWTLRPFFGVSRPAFCPGPGAVRKLFLRFRANHRGTLWVLVPMWFTLRHCEERFAESISMIEAG